MDVGKSLTYVFEDPDWIKKVLIGGLVNIVPILNFASMGYALHHLKNVYEDRVTPLPEWDEFGNYFMKGLYAFIGQFIYALPLILVGCCIWIVSIASASAMTPDRNGNPTGPAAGIVTLVFICGGCLMALYGIALAVITPSLLTRFALSGQFNTLFQFREAWALIQTNVSSYITAVLVYIVAAVIASVISPFTCGLGLPFLFMWVYLVMAYAFGVFAKGLTAPLTPSMPVVPPAPAV